MADDLPKGGSFLIEETDPASIFTPEDFTEEQRMFAKTAEDFIHNEVIPKIEQTEAKEEGVMVELLKKSGELGLLMIDVPEKYGGLELDKATSMLVTEVISKGGAFAVTYAVHIGIGTLPVSYFGTPVQKEKYLTKLATGELIGSYALTEAGSGSDALAAKTRADLSDDGKYYILNGEKTFLSNGGFADLIIVFAKVGGEEFSAFIVERGYDGLTLGAEEKKLGIRGSSTVQIFLDNVKVPVENLLGEKGKGHKIAFNILNVGRFKLGVGSVGSAKIAIDDSIKYANERQQFGKPIASFGMIKNKIANMATYTYVTESMSYRTAGLMDGILSPIDRDADDASELTMKGIEEYVTECSIMKVKGTEMIGYVADESVQIFGGYGYVEDYPAERYFRDARIGRIYEGTNEINRMLIPGMLLKRAMKGEIPLMAAAKKLQDELLEFPMMEETEEEGLLIEEKKLVQNVKKVSLLTAGVAVQKFMDKLQDQQGVLGNLADIIIEAYGMESALLRTLKIAASKGEDGADVVFKMTRLYIYDTIGKIDQWAREVLAACSDGDELRTMLAALRRLTRNIPVDTLGLRLEIADYFIEKEKYEI
ncbi:MAG: acyl-CoA dehydrogenase family protein [Candidatus Latescibacterota bacterium]|nr:MAG: acyl-CoA dehydrogenase family protein [Candidatus Latescibacterota bacterium]